MHALNDDFDGQIVPGHEALEYVEHAVFSAVEPGCAKIVSTGIWG